MSGRQRVSGLFGDILRLHEGANSFGAIRYELHDFDALAAVLKAASI
jgi:hypothetical protein